MNKLITLLAVLCLLSGFVSSKKQTIAERNKIITTTNAAKLPEDLLYNNEPIPDECMNELVPIICASIDSKEIDLDTFFISKTQSDIIFSDEQFKYEWSYIGTLPNGNHLVYGYLWPAGAMGKFTEIAVIRRTGNKLTALAWIQGGDRHATMIASHSCHLHENVLTYEQHMTNGSLYETLMKQFPECSSYAENKNNEELFWGEGDYLGYGTFEITITPNDKLKNHHLKSFTFADFGSDPESKESYHEWIKKTPKGSHTMGYAFNQILKLYSYKNGNRKFNITQLKEIIITACDYAKEREIASH